MNPQTRRYWLAGLIALGLSSALLMPHEHLQGQPPAAPGKPPKDRNLQLFMRQKLVASNLILEGLCTDNFELIQEGAKKLHEMSDAERWHVSNDVMYKQFSNEYRQITRQLIQAAEDQNLDRATLKWLDATVSCLDCHRFVRGARIAAAKQP
jgi:hypothetical protein